MIQFTCSCGKPLRANEQLVGQRIKCPHCQAVQVVPEGEDANGASPAPPAAKTQAAIRFACSCGKQMAARSELAGKRTKCPACGEILTIPATEEGFSEKPKKLPVAAAPPAHAPVEEDDEPFAHEPQTPRLRGKQRVEEDESEDEDDDEAPRPRKKAAKKNSSAVLWIAIAAGVLLVGGGLAWWFWPKGGPDKGLPDRGGRGAERPPDKGLPDRGGRGAELPADLKQVPGNALGFVTVRVADLWNSDVGQQLQKALPEGNPIGEMEKATGLTPADIERVSLVVPSMDNKLSWAVMAFSKTVDEKKIVALLAKSGQEMTQQGKKYHANASTAVYFVDEKTLMVGAPAGIRHFLETSGSGTGTGPLSDLVKQAATSKHHIYGAAYPPAQLLQDFKKQPGAEMFAPLLEVQSATLTIDLGPEIAIDLSAKFPDQDKAKNAQQTAQGLVGTVKLQMPSFKKMFANSPFGSYIGQAEQVLNTLKIVQDGAEVRVAIKHKVDWPQVVQALKNALDGVQKAATGQKVSLDLKMLALASHNHNDEKRSLPAADWGKGLSWRVALLPYLGQKQLFDQFRLDEPWDGPNNIKLLSKMPAVFKHPTAPPSESMTYYQVFTGPDTPFNGKIAGNIPRTFPDGTSNTLLIVESSKAVSWTKPEDIPYSPQQPVPKLGVAPLSFYAAMADGSVVHLARAALSDSTLRAAITPAGNEVPGKDWATAQIRP